MPEESWTLMAQMEMVTLLEAFCSRPLSRANLYKRTSGRISSLPISFASVFVKMVLRHLRFAITFMIRWVARGICLAIIVLALPRVAGRTDRLWVYTVGRHGCKVNRIPPQPNLHRRRRAARRLQPSVIQSASPSRQIRRLLLKPPRPPPQPVKVLMPQLRQVRQSQTPLWPSACQMEALSSASSASSWVHSCFRTLGLLLLLDDIFLKKTISVFFYSPIVYCNPWTVDCIQDLKERYSG